jgi:hypothetical protein
LHHQILGVSNEELI